MTPGVSLRLIDLGFYLGDSKSGERKEKDASTAQVAGGKGALRSGLPGS